MRILHILDHSLPQQSGYVYRTLGILHEQRRRGWETLHLTSAKQGREAGKRKVEGWHFFRTPALVSRFWRLPILRQIAVVVGLRRRLLQLARKTRPDVLHAHSPALNGLAALYVGRRLNLPVVYEVRAFWEDAAGDSTTGRVRGGRYWLTRALENHVLKQAQAITTICHGLKADLLERGIAGSRITVIPNAVICPAVVQRAKNSLQDKVLALPQRLILGFAGSYYAYEGLDWLISILPALLVRWPTLHLLCAGGGPQEEKMRQRVHSLALDDKVSFLGRLPHPEVAGLYRQATIMIYPRLAMRLTELVTPLKPLEAMAHGCLVLASDVGGHRELIVNGQTGTLFRAGDAEHLLAMMSRLLAHPERWQYLRENALQTMRFERTWERSVAAYDAVYQGVLK